MRMLLKVQMPVERGNEAFKSGALQRTIESTVATLEPEAAYFYAEDGKRTALFIFEMEGSWELPPTVEPLFEYLDASVHVTPVMNGDDLQRGLGAAGS
ncbi:MAG: hypothetical protein IT201_03935 [Thermoleophilia bacterium]|nr:hypothetical protein [Thermoleophilia bacterium]